MAFAVLSIVSHTGAWQLPLKMRQMDTENQK
jgi:hypothetical protein